ncbi:hypothetical protein GQ607_004617, partial [Colletotrichum asianum]
SRSARQEVDPSAEPWFSHNSFRVDAALRTSCCYATGAKEMPQSRLASPPRRHDLLRNLVLAGAALSAVACARAGQVLAGLGSCPMVGSQSPTPSTPQRRGNQ